MPEFSWRSASLERIDVPFQRKVAAEDKAVDKPAAFRGIRLIQDRHRQVSNIGRDDIAIDQQLQKTGP